MFYKLKTIDEFISNFQQKIDCLTVQSGDLIKQFYYTFFQVRDSLVKVSQIE